MQVQHLSKQDAITLLELIHDCLACSGEAEVRTLMGRLNNLLTYQAALSCIAKMGESGTLLDLKIVNLDYPAAYLQDLAAQDLISKDPVVRENFTNFRMQYWQDTLQRCQSSPDAGKVEEILSLAEDFGFRKVRSGCGYGHGISNPGRTEGSLFCYHGLQRSRRTEEILHLIVPHFHEALRRLIGPASEALTLTPKEIEVLNWVKLGKCTWDISVILSISERTVKFHVKNILRKLGATTRAHAVAKGLEFGIIYME